MKYSERNADMQYILTQAEYDELKNVKKKTDMSHEKELQKICTKVANEMPIKWDWGDHDLKPWGCSVTKEDWYCDQCPVISICPKEWKSFSQ